MILKYFGGLLLCCMCSLGVRAQQNVQSVQNLFLKENVTSTNSGNGAMNILSVSSNQTRTYNILFDLLQDTSEIKDIHIRLKYRSTDSTFILRDSISFSPMSTPSSLSYTQTGASVNLELKGINYLPIWFLELWIEDRIGRISTVSTSIK